MASIDSCAVRGSSLEQSTDAGETGRSSALLLALWAGIVFLGGALVYVVLVAAGIKRLDGAPLHATFDPYVGWRILAPAGILVAVVLLADHLRALAWRRLLAVWWLVAAGWAVALAVARQPRRLASPLEHRGEYLAAVPDIGSVGTFLDTFVERISSYPVHVQGHPPGFVLLGHALHAVGAGGALPLSVVVVAAGTAAVPLVLIAVRDVVDERWARATAPFLAIGPTAIWIAASADAFYTGVGAAAVALVVLATGRRGRSRVYLALAGGVMFGLAAMLSYGLVLLGAVPLTVAAARRALDTVVIAAIGGAIVVFGVAVTGFWWVDGLDATRDRYVTGIASERPYALFLLANVSILLLALGPAVFVAVCRLRNRSCWLLVGGALIALAIADLSGMSKSEVERIWLPFMPFVVVSAGALVPQSRSDSVHSLDSGTRWLVLQGGAAAVLESMVRTAW